MAVGSTNPAKVGPVRSVFARLMPGCRVVAVAVPSGVASQPTSLAMTRDGAVRRGQAALRAVPQALFGVGVEGGVDFDLGGRPWLVTVAAVADPSGQVTTGEGMRLQLPERFAQPLREGQELARLVDEAFGVSGSRTDPGAVGHLTRGVVTRRLLVKVAVAAALAPRLHPELYAHFRGSGS